MCSIFRTPSPKEVSDSLKVTGILVLKYSYLFPCFLFYNYVLKDFMKGLYPPFYLQKVINMWRHPFARFVAEKSPELSTFPRAEGFQDSASPVMEGIVDLHNYIFFYLILIFCFVSWIFLYIIYNFMLKPNYFYGLGVGTWRDYITLKWFPIVYVSGYFREGMEAFEYLHTTPRRTLLERDYLYNRRVDNPNYRGGHFTFSDNMVNCGIVMIRSIQISYFKKAAEGRVMWRTTRSINHNMEIEVIWTLIPTLILILIAFPSFSLLYSMDEVIDPGLTVKVVGYQWFWTYEYGRSYNDLKYNYFTDMFGYNYKHYRKARVFESVMIDEKDLTSGQHRLLEVDRQMILPTNVHIRCLITAGDVLHSWAVPSLGLKVDAVPGRLSQLGLYIKREGTFYGQCSELCGVNHGFMPIVVKAVNLREFLFWYQHTDIIWNDYQTMRARVRMLTRIKRNPYIEHRFRKLQRGYRSAYFWNFAKGTDSCKYQLYNTLDPTHFVRKYFLYEKRTNWGNKRAFWRHNPFDNERCEYVNYLYKDVWGPLSTQAVKDHIKIRSEWIRYALRVRRTRPGGIYWTSGSRKDLDAKTLPYRKKTIDINSWKKRPRRLRGGIDVI